MSLIPILAAWWVVTQPERDMRKQDEQKKAKAAAEAKKAAAPADRMRYRSRRWMTED